MTGACQQRCRQDRRRSHQAAQDRVDFGTDLPRRAERARGSVPIHLGVPAGMVQQTLVYEDIDDVRGTTKDNRSVGKECRGEKVQRRVLAALHPIAASQRASAGHLQDSLGGHRGHRIG